MIHNLRFLTAIGVALCLSGFSAHALEADNVTGPRIESEVRVPRIFSDNMVLQEGTNTAVWGWADDDDAIVWVMFDKQIVSTRSANGKWHLNLHNLKPGGPYTLTITSRNTIQIKNVMVGEVWVASGQSNMEFPLRDSFMGAGDVAAAANPMIRVLKVPHTRLDDPTNDIRAGWSEAGSDSVANFSAVAYYFARDLQAQLHIPIGIIESDWGGTPAEAWMDHDFLDSDRHFNVEILKEYLVEKSHYDVRMVAFQNAKRQAQDSGTEFTNRAPNRPWEPSELYNGMIAPLVHYTIKGVIWYQGESNAGSLERADQYHRLFPGLIVNWRRLWNEPDLPFLLVQLAPYMDIQKEPGESAWASLREAQLQSTWLLPNVGMAVITDVGMEHNIHPVKKMPVGDRLALAARAIAYHEPIEYSGPEFNSMKVEGSHIIVTFTHIGGGLEARDGELTGFALAGDDQKYHWALARIVAWDKVLVYCPDVEIPVAVRYGWANYPVVNLWNKAGLPATPFRTDNFAK